MIMLCRKGTSSEVKRYVLIRHFTYKILFDFYVINIYLLMEGTEGVDSEYEEVFKPMPLWDLVGFFVALSRFLEPYVFHTFKT